MLDLDVRDLDTPGVGLLIEDLLKIQPLDAVVLSDAMRKRTKTPCPAKLLRSTTVST